MNLRVPYQNFFIKSEEGKAFMDELDRLVGVCHENAEKDADKSRDYTQQARGIRQVIEYIQSATTETGKGRGTKL